MIAFEKGGKEQLAVEKRGKEHLSQRKKGGGGTIITLHKRRKGLPCFKRKKLVSTNHGEKEGKRGRRGEAGKPSS